MQIQTKGQATAPTTNQQANAQPAKQAAAKTQPKTKQTVSLSPKAMALSKQAQLEQKKTEEDKAYQFKQPNSLRDRILNSKYNPKLAQMSLRAGAGSGDGTIHLTDWDRERLKEAYIYADKNGLDSKTVNRTAFYLSNLRDRQAMERNGTQFANHIPTPEHILKKMDRDENGLLIPPGYKNNEDNELSSFGKALKWSDSEYQNSQDYIKRRDEFLEMIKPNPYLQQFVDEVIKAL